MPMLDVVTLTHPHTRGNTIEDSDKKPKQMVQTLQPKFGQTLTPNQIHPFYETKTIFNRKVTADQLQATKNLDASKILSIANRMGMPSDESKVFYKTSGLTVKSYLKSPQETSTTLNYTESRLRKRSAAPNSALMNLKKNQVKEVVLAKIPTHENLQTQIQKHKAKLSSFYRKVDIENVTESQIMNQEATIDYPEAASPDLKLRENLEDPLFKNQMAKKVLQNICTPRVEQD